MFLKPVEVPIPFLTYSYLQKRHKKSGATVPLNMSSLYLKRKLFSLASWWPVAPARLRCPGTGDHGFWTCKDVK